MTTTAVKERPILFSGSMVRAILDGRKTQTRRVVKPQPIVGRKQEHWTLIHEGRLENLLSKSMFQVGMKLWVRETWAMECNENFMDVYDKPDNPLGPVRWHDYDEGGQYFECPRYEASEPDTQLVGADWEEYGLTEMKWRPSIHMPRWASRITLEITGVRVERVQDISETDAIDEGAFAAESDEMQQTARVAVSEGRMRCTVRDYFRELWDTINAKRGFGWDTNPWVWAIEFRRIEP